MKCILSVIGTRPELIKMAPVIAEMDRYPHEMRSLVCVTGQHREMLDQALATFAIRPDFDLDLMCPDQSLSQLTAGLVAGLDDVVQHIRPDWILAQGDTTSVMTAALVAFYHRIPFGHIEAGLRTAKLQQPFPEELNRRMADTMSSIWFAPTELARQTLLSEGYPQQDVILTGNTVVDALQLTLQRDYDWATGPLANIPLERRLVLVTVHRRESFGEPLREICLALRQIAETLADEGVHFVWPVHRNPKVDGPVREMLTGMKNISLLEPLDYFSLVHLMRKSLLILTDSGGIQEEAPSLGIPVLVLRETTERPEGVESGFARLVGASRCQIVTQTIELLSNPHAYMKMVPTKNPYGDGHAARRIVSALMERCRQ